MRRWASGLVLLALSAWTASAIETKFDGTEDNQQQCAGMYSQSAWGGPVDPFILVNFNNVTGDQGADPVVSLVIFEYKDEDLIGVQPDPNDFKKIYQCEQKYVDQGFCNETHIGEFILAPNATKATNMIFTKAIHLKDTKPINYPITKTGYYCVLTFGHTTDTYSGTVVFRNAYGELPAAQIPKLAFYGGITLAYALLSVFWAFLYFQHRSDILAVQNYITAILVFLVVEMLMTWGFYDHLNRAGSNVGSKVLLVIVAVLNAMRNSFSFFLLLIVCMGYGVVKPTLGRTMIWVRWLAIAHFVFGLAYAMTTLLITNVDDASIWLLFIVLPLAGTLTAFYVWTLNSLNLTLKDLRERKQHVKEAMYKKLWWCILVSILVIFAFFFFTSFSLASARDPDYVPFHWKTRWFVIDGWLNLVYFADVAWIAYVWRPSANNRRFAMSDELAQDDDGNFEIANLDIGAPDDSDDDEEAGPGGKPVKGGTEPRYDAPPRAQPQQSQPSQSRQVSQPQQREQPRESLDGETIFAVGEDGDKFSDSGSDEDDNLVKGDRK